MSKKNRHKSRHAQRASNPPKTAAAEAVVAAPTGQHESDDAEPREVAAHDADLPAFATTAIATDDTGNVEPIEGGDADRLEDDIASVATNAAGAATAPAPLPFTVPTPAPMASQGDIRGVLIQVAGARLLLPNATIAEVLSYADPEPVGADAPAWLLGRLRWRGWQVPLIAFGTLAGVAEERAALGSKVVVLKALAGTSRTPYFAMLTQGFPRLVTVSRQTLSVADDDAGSMPPGVQARVRLNEDAALLPDLEAIEAIVADAIAHAA